MEERKENLEQLLTRLRTEKGWTYDDLLLQFNDLNLTQDTFKKWESGLEYPDLDMMFKLSEIYKIPVEKFVEAKNEELETSLNSFSMKMILWISKALGVSFKVAMVLMVIIYVLALIGSFCFFMFVTSHFSGSRI